MKPKAPEDRIRAYPSNRAKPGTKAKTRTEARQRGAMTFNWHCPKHGMAVFSTAGAGTCRQCVAQAQRAVRERRKAESATNQ
ncbi:hypothetical protein ACT2E5_07215 [Burkholderia vietnamiensis]|uniref:hypothetical protein n=1 Tax=Burkholderia vietnamiensis TaxID=60552 RepID=UPI00402AC420